MKIPFKILLGVLALNSCPLPIHRAEAQLFTNLHSLVFTNGTDPVAGLVLSGNTLYGTASIYGGGAAGGSGSVFRMNTDGSSFTNLHTFTQHTDGGNLHGGLVLAGGTLYGPAYFGGGLTNGCVFAISTNGTGLTNVYSFSPTSANSPFTNSDGGNPEGSLILSGANLYGVANNGGAHGWGTVFGVNTNGTVFTNLHSFKVTDGQYPGAPLIVSGNTLYGTTPDGGTFNGGTIFKVNTDGSGFTNFYNFTFPSGTPPTNNDGSTPLCGLLLSGGTLYGTAFNGGNFGNGTIFSVGTNGLNFTVLHQFSATNASAANADGAAPQAGLILSSNILYGTASLGGSSGNGTVFQVNTDGSAFSTLHNFTSTNTPAGTNTDGAHPVGSLILANGVLYGTAQDGGFGPYGTIFGIVLPPTLSIALSGTNAILTWPTNLTGFNLQSATNLASPITWSAVGGQNAVTNPLSGKQKFFRLIYP